jgi:hypothetical protein
VATDCGLSRFHHLGLHCESDPETVMANPPAAVCPAARPPFSFMVSP